MRYKTVYAKPRQHDEEEDQDDLKFPFGELEKKPYKQFDQVFSAQHTHFYLSKAIGEPEGYTDMIHKITTASSADVIFIHLNTPGGQLDTGVQLINAMTNSAAKIVTVLESMAHSLGTLIFLSGDEMVVNEHCVMMFHNFNGGLIGKGNEMVSELEATVKWFQALAEDIYIPFLSQDEFNRIVKGEDMWMQTPEIKVRLENMVAIMSKKEAAEDKQELIVSTKKVLEDATKLLAKLDPPPKAPKAPKAPNPKGYRKGPARATDKLKKAATD
jgi:ATP-dependent protease ClpP protease subunit